MKLQEIKKAFEMNNDGAGFAWISQDENKNKRLNYRKGFMNVDDLIEAYKANNMKSIRPHVVHFRNATSAVVPELTHPYAVNSQMENELEYTGISPLLFHNGVFHNWKERMLDFFISRGVEIPPGQFSDTRFIAIMIATLGRNGLSLLNAGKFVYVSINKIDLIGDFINDHGILYSNLSYKGSYYDKGGRRSNEPSGPLSVNYNGTRLRGTDNSSYEPDDDELDNLFHDSDSEEP